MNHATGKLPLVSVVIPTFNRLRQIRECLDALRRQTLATEFWEVVVVDDGSTVPIAPGDLASEAAPFRLRLIHQPNAGPGLARNHGVRVAHGRLVAFTDDDCRPEPDWLETLVVAWEATPEALLGGSVANGLPENLPAEASQLILDLVYEHYNADPEKAYFFTSNNLLCTRESFLRLGGFRFRVSEDRDFCDRWRAEGGTLRWVAGARVQHYHRQGFVSFLRLHFRYGRGALLYHEHRKRRQSGTLSDESGFRRSVPGRLRARLGSYRLSARLRLIGAFVGWQIAGASGYLAESVRSWFGSSSLSSSTTHCEKPV